MSCFAPGIVVSWFDDPIEVRELSQFMNDEGGLGDGEGLFEIELDEANGRPKASRFEEGEEVKGLPLTSTKETELLDEPVVGVSVEKGFSFSSQIQALLFKL